MDIWTAFGMLRPSRYDEFVRDNLRRMVEERGGTWPDEAPAAPEPKRKARGAPRLKSREPEEWQIEEAIKYQDACANNTPRTKAAKLLRRDYRTIEGWIEAWPDYIERERERRKRK